MFKNIVLLSAVVFFVLPLTIEANNLAQSTCEYIAADNKKRLRALLKDNRLKVKTLNKMVFCDNKDILLFADEKKAFEVGKMIVKKLPKKIIRKALPSLQHEALITAANDRVN
ncbi:DUF3718 domain-containing protein [Thalassotalea sp. M1531]|uniref:DUF3718 domain-containing protein n=1 Tax=Thalassotalea algicola TaxID=2716224 RepID=A0A7Y0L8N0_9GAMM|nr:DUF3718 domain-containing protein [Thalassotalea algicola]NMP29994.1 DUF3718 domain-containing protein [Thalassotalea algicola]